MTAYTAICERAGKWWEITVPELPSGGVTQAKRLDQVPETVRSLVHLMTGTEPGEIRMEIRMPDGIRDEVARARQLREKAEAEAKESAALSREAARRLAADGLPVRDIGEILGVSHQRAHQFLAVK
ncbi:MAG: hypothetical protein ACRDNS_33550 [Trebonia sp.]